MSKTILIIKKEYLTRVRKRSFIIGTILFPLLYLALIFGVGYLREKSKSTQRVALIDESGFFDKGSIEKENQQDSSSVVTLVNIPEDSLSANYTKMGYTSYLIIPADTKWDSGAVLELKSLKTVGEGATAPVERKLNNIWSEIKNERLGINDTAKNILANSRLSVAPVNIVDKTANSKSATLLGYIAGILIYLIVLIYGSQVMMGIMEEKTNRIAEVIISSVKPFQLMLGKIIGIGMVALTQFLLWIVFIFVIYNVSKGSGSGDSMSGVVGNVQNIFTSINIPLIIFCFVFYLLGGFFFYASFYAAIGSAVNEDMREAQSLSFPITLIIILSISILSIAIADPTGPIAFWGSIIPFSSPIIMMARIPFGVPGTVPWWQLGLSMVLLIVGFIFTVWLSGRIYRTGILLYGKKPSWKEMLKWVVRRS